MVVFCEKLCFQIFRSKLAEDGPKIKFKFFEKSVHEIFWIFCIRSQQRKCLKLGKTYICEIVGLAF